MTYLIDNDGGLKSGNIINNKGELSLCCTLCGGRGGQVGPVVVSCV